MARAKKNEQVEEIGTPDFDLALKIYREDIKPATSKASEFNQEKSTAFKAIKKQARVSQKIAKFVFGLMETEEAKRDIELRDLNGMLAAAGLTMPVDLVDVAEGKGEAGSPVVPTAERPARPKGRPQLAAVKPPADDSDLLNAAE